MTNVHVDPASERTTIGQLKPGDRFMGPPQHGAPPGELVGAMVTNLVRLLGTSTEEAVEIDSPSHRAWLEFGRSTWPVALRLRDGHAYALPPGTSVIRLGVDGYAEPGQIVMRYDTRTGTAEYRVGHDLAEEQWAFEANAWGDLITATQEMQVRRVSFTAKRGATPRRALVHKLAQEARDLWKANADPAKLIVRDTIDHLLTRALSAGLDQPREVMKFVRGEPGEDKGQ